MPSEFSTDAARTTFQLPALTKQQIKALTDDLDTSAREVIIRAVAGLWQREIGEPDRDLATEVDEIKQRLDAIEAEFRRRAELQDSQEEE